MSLFDSLFKKPSAEELIGPVANPANFSEEELAALKEASLSEEAPARGPERYTTIDNPPAALLNDVFPNFPLPYFTLFRNNRGLTTPPEVWDFVRTRWPVLAGKTNEQLYEALGPITAVKVDFRQL
eukprot:CAMPEP_0119323118 /NCGR_PEP_ID=MMETSP1333-20130426/60055_1 /TAXON_ID=418940 /ORGANISM="Scyphosphaera apsteinii, Strain RCC1455" /LENGTH=125 /DNA_ID=CAMNT_0007330499 /DNA_START=204 /DNA_END=582 /DNA_ORIENTATION=-